MASDKTWNILHVLPTIDPKAGGPVEGVRQRGIRLKQWGHQVDVVTLDDPDLPFVADFPLNAHALGPSRGGYRYNAKLVPWLKLNSGMYDAVIVNGLWQYNGLGVWRALQNSKVPYYVFTHGALDPWFKHEYPLKHLKKWIYWPWAEYRVLRDAKAVLFTSDEERLTARESFWLYRVSEKVVAYGTGAPPEDAGRLRARFISMHPELRGRRILLFLSRIHEKKGCDLLVRAFAEVASQEPSLHLVIAGPGHEALVEQLKRLGHELGVGDRISWPGMLKGEDKWGAFYSAEAFILPSHQENFGIAIAEALACGVPVLITNKVNIWREITADGSGFVEPDTLSGTTQLLKRWLSLESEARQQMSRCARQSYQSRFNIDAMATSLLDVLAERQLTN